MIEVMIDWYDGLGGLQVTTIPAVFRRLGVNPSTGRGGNRIGEILNDLRTAQLANFYQRLPGLGNLSVSFNAIDGEETVLCPIPTPGRVISRVELTILSGAPEDYEGNPLGAKVERVGFAGFADAEFRVGPLEPVQLSDQLFFPPSPKHVQFVFYKRPEVTALVNVLYDNLPMLAYRLGNAGSFTPWDYNSYD